MVASLALLAKQGAGGVRDSVITCCHHPSTALSETESEL